MKRTHLPLNAMRVFDAAARHLSFTNAADELAVTPAAVGQQIRALEDMLGVVLFRRTPKGLELTIEAQAGLLSLRSGFLQLEESVRAMQAGQSSNRITIAAPRDFTAKWLSAKLTKFIKNNPDISFNIVADENLDFTEANLDAAIRFTDGPSGHEGMKLGSKEFVMVNSPENHVERLIIWPGCPITDDNALHVGDAGLAVDAAAHGLGKAYVPAMIAQSDIEKGHIKKIDTAVDVSEATSGYWLIAPLPQWRQQKVKALVAALAS